MLAIFHGLKSLSYVHSLLRILCNCRAQGHRAPTIQKGTVSRATTIEKGQYYKLAFLGPG